MKKAITETLSLIDIASTTLTRTNGAINGCAYFQGSSKGNEFIAQIPLFKGLITFPTITVQSIDENLEVYERGVVVLMNGSELINHLGVEFEAPEVQQAA